MLAFGAVASQAALAVEGVGVPGKFPATVKASQIGKVVTTVGSAGARKMECSTETFQSAEAISSPTSTLVMIPFYAGCITSPGGGPASITTNGCVYSITASQKFSASSGEGEGSLVCPEGKAVLIVADSTAGSLVCEWSAGSQGPIKTATWASKASDVLISLNLTGIKAKVLKGTLAACGAAAGGVTSASTTGEITGTAESGGSATSLVIN
jgi:hypothetical protein